MCSNPIDAEVLADYWLAALAAPEEDAVEEHLLGCDYCGSRLSEIMELAKGVRQLAREGSLRMVVSEAFLHSASEDGLHVRQYAVPAGGAVECTVTAEDDMLIARLSADLRGTNRVDLCLCDESGVEQLRLADITVHPGASDVLYQESITFAKAMPTGKLVARLLAFDDAGRERLVGEYTFNHTRSLPDPAEY